MTDPKIPFTRPHPPLAPSPRSSRGACLTTLVLGFLLATAPSFVVAQEPGQDDTLPAVGAIRGLVMDAESGEPLRAAQVAALEADSGERLGAVLTDADGQFHLRDLPAGTVTVSLVYVGYAALEQEDVEVEAGQVTDAGEFRMRVEAIQVEGVGIESRRSAVSFEADRTVYRMEGMPTVSGGSLSDALGGVPELDVDFEGRVEFEGQTPEIYLNGRPAPVDGESLTVFLEQFPADRIDRIEVIPNPSARFEAEGAGGIVNIVLAEDVELGLTGSVFANAGTRGEVGSGGRIAWQRGELTVQGGGFIRHNDRETASSSIRENLLADPVTFLEQDRLTRRGGLTGGVDMTTEYGLSDRTLVWARTRINDLGSDSEGETRSTRLDDEGTALDLTRRLTETDRDRSSLDLQGGVQVNFDDELGDHEFSVEVRRDARRTETFRSFATERLDDVDLPIDTRLDETLEDRSRVRLRADYTRPIGETQVEMGVRGQYRDTESIRDALGFLHQERFHSVFATAARSLGSLGLQLGVRLENSAVTLELPDAADTGVDQRYTSVFPTANVSWRFDGGQQLRFSYGQRIRRPNARRINPLDRSDDPLLRRIGNPDLAPQYTHNVRLDASWRGSVGTVRVTPFYRFQTDEWAELRTVDAEGVATEQWENVATTHQVGSSLSLSARDLRGWSGTVRISGRQEFRSDDVLELERRGGSALRWSVRGNLDREFGRDFSAQARVNYNPAREIPQGFVSSSLMTRFGVRARVLDRRASVNLSVRDPFNLYDRTFESRDPSHVELRSTGQDTRAAVLSVSYTLGSPGR
ncbi:MAG: TonB-dependent receptor [Gemmatimonadales bacterium]|nr:MAG: TonB-dependent receptor [Gemmatimonadales bacterium]